MEPAKIQKVVKRDIRKDCKAFEESLVKDIIEESWSMHKLRKEMNRGQNLIIKIRVEVEN